MGMIVVYFYHLLWLLTHMLVTLVTYARDVYHLVYNRLMRVLCGTRDKEAVFAGVHKLPKLPQHLTVLLPSSPPPADSMSALSKQLDVLVNLVLFSLATNITYVSFYDPMGLLIKREEELIKKIHCKLDQSQRLIWHGMNTPGKNGFAGPKVHVKIITAGRTSLVDSCKQLVHTAQTLTVPVVDKHQMASYEFPEPQLAIYFGAYLNLCGYPPWQIRLTEFVSGGVFDAFDAEQFSAVLHRFSQCEQRVGK